jgi:hypothetical protein
MPKYRITGPDGGTYEVTAPEGATQEQVLAYAQQNYKPQVGRSGVTREQRQAEVAPPTSQAGACWRALQPSQICSLLR